MTDNPPIRILINRIENRITFKNESGYYLSFLTPETMKLLGSTKIKILKDKNGENVPHLVLVLTSFISSISNQVVLAHCNIASNNSQHDLRVF